MPVLWLAGSTHEAHWQMPTLSRTHHSATSTRYLTNPTSGRKTGLLSFVTTPTTHTWPRFLLTTAKSYFKRTNRPYATHTKARPRLHDADARHKHPRNVSLRCVCQQLRCRRDHRHSAF